MKRRAVLMLATTILLLSLGAAFGAHRAAASESTGDGGWVWQHGLGAGVVYNDVVFVDAENGWAVGSGGRIVHTFDGGATWYKQRSGTTADLSQVRFVDPRHGWAIGVVPDPNGSSTPSGSRVLRTTDGGDTWDEVPGIPPSWIPRSVAFTSATDGWMDGADDSSYQNAMYRSSDGGQTWSVYTFPNDEMPTALGQIVFKDAQTGWCVNGSAANTGVDCTTDGGQSWTSRLTGCPYPISALAFDGDQTLITGGFGGVFCRSTDGGRRGHRAPTRRLTT